MREINDIRYFQLRAVQEHERACAATNPVVARIHLEMAEQYEAKTKVQADDPSPS